MRKLAVSLVTLTSLTACSRGDEVGTHWSFEMPDNMANDEALARFGEQLAVPGYDSVVSVDPAISDQAQPSFISGSPVATLPPESADRPSDITSTQPNELDAMLADQLEAEFEVVDEPASSDPADVSLRDALGDRNSSDLSLDELVELNLPQRGPRPDPLVQVRFSQGEPVSSNQHLEELYSAAPTNGQFGMIARPSAMALAQAVPIPPSAFVTEQSHRVELNLSNRLGGPESSPPIDLSLNDDFGLGNVREDSNRSNGSEPALIDSFLAPDGSGQNPGSQEKQPLLDPQSSLREDTGIALAKVPDLIIDHPLEILLNRRQGGGSFLQRSVSMIPRLAVNLGRN